MWRCLRVLDEIDQDVITGAIGNDNMDAGRLYVTGCVVLGVHTTTSEGTLLCLDILREVGAWGNRSYQL